MTTCRQRDDQTQIQSAALQIPSLWNDETLNGRRTPLKEARSLQRLIFDTASSPRTTAVALSALARAWCALQSSIREMRGIPLPGQLRPDLDPTQLARAVKRSRGRQPIDVASATNAGFADDDQPTRAGAAPTPKPTLERAAVPSPAKEKPKTPDAKERETSATAEMKTGE